MQKILALLFAACFVPLSVLAAVDTPSDVKVPATPDATAASAAPGVSPVAQRQLSLADQEFQRISGLVESGALPRARLEEARQKLADAQDEQILQRSLYGGVPLQSLTAEQSQEMVAAAARRLDRQKQAIATMQNLVDSGMVARSSLDSLKTELAFRETTYSLAQSRAQLLDELAAMARTEQNELAHAGTGGGIEEHFPGKGALSPADVQTIEAAYQRKFDRPLPISAYGETAVHRALGFDHRGRVDVALNPDQAEGVWLRQFLESRNIPFYAFRAAVPGKATGAHIHIGPGSTRLPRPIEAD